MDSLQLPSASSPSPAPPGVDAAPAANAAANAAAAARARRRSSAASGSRRVSVRLTNGQVVNCDNRKVVCLVRSQDRVELIGAQFNMQKIMAKILVRIVV